MGTCIKRASNVFSYVLVEPEGCSGPLIRRHFPIGMFLRLGKARWYCNFYKRQYFIVCYFPLHNPSSIVYCLSSIVCRLPSSVYHLCFSTCLAFVYLLSPWGFVLICWIYPVKLSGMNTFNVRPRMLDLWFCSDTLHRELQVCTGGSVRTFVNCHFLQAKRSWIRP